MLKLTPFEETTAGREILQDHSVKLLAEQIQLKFSPSSETLQEITGDLRKLSLESLEDLFKAILNLKTVEQLEIWIDERISKIGEEAKSK